MNNIKQNIKSPFGKFNGNELEYALRVLDSENPDNGKFGWVNEFEQSFCKLSGARYAISVSSATAGLHTALMACGVGKNDEVIQPGLTVVMNAFTTILSNATPVFVDVDRKTYNIDLNEIEKKINLNTKVIMPVSLFGLPSDLDPIMKLAKKHGLYVIDDCAETICGLYKNQFAGSSADIAVYSFENKKHMSSGSEGGMIITNNKDLATKIRKFAGIGYKNLGAEQGRTNASPDFQNPNYERHDTIALNYRMNAITAAIGLGQLDRIPHLVERRKCVGNMFLDSIKNCDWMIPQFKPDNCNHTQYSFAVLYDGLEKKGIKWKDFYNKFVDSGGDGFYAAWKNPYLEPALKGKVFGNTKCNEGLCPIAEDLQKKIMLFKTNYRDLSKARFNADLLSKLIDEIGR